MKDGKSNFWMCLRSCEVDNKMINKKVKYIFEIIWKKLSSLFPSVRCQQINLGEVCSIPGKKREKIWNSNEWDPVLWSMLYVQVSLVIHGDYIPEKNWSREYQAACNVNHGN
jgi:hypothetical protein